ncbi:sensor histidine kinase [Promicromonospora kroppenstedtii]|uniref:sensor histidine kinase n=1 Tax=Promicromonospora kroppenstedtii TaxID=440482 RepID=UPI0004B8D195|nr:HAMP domain-containing sensor histidine kinase [Promicromonospora kroppenstedtii]
MTDVQFMVLVTVACSVVAAVVGLVAIRAARRRSLMLALLLAALFPVAAVVAALAVNVSAMFISPHDASVVWLVLGTASVLEILLALALGRIVAREVQLVVDGARELGQVPALDVPGAGTSRSGVAAPETAELAAVMAELEATRERLSASRAAERAARDARRQILGFVSHDLVSPLSGIRAATDGLRDGIFPDPATALDGIEAAVGRMSRMVGDLGELSRSDDLPRRAEPGLVDMAAVLQGVLAHARPAAAENGVELDESVAGDVHVRGDQDELSRVLDNLVSNAVRSSGPGGRVLVGVVSQDGFARLSVRDTCGGIPDDEVPHMFRAGFQGGKAGGSGLGLAFVDRVVDEHGGKVSVRSTGAGCDVEVRLPAAE